MKNCNLNSKIFSQVISTVLFLALSLAAPIEESKLATTTFFKCPARFFSDYSNFQCFQIVNGTKAFMDTEAYCNIFGGNLVSIHNGFDDNLIVNSLVFGSKILI